MAVKIFAKVSYNINGVASPSFIVASAWTDELNEMNGDESKISSFFYNYDFPFFTTVDYPTVNEIDSTLTTQDFPFDGSPEEVFGMFGVVENEKYPFGSYMPAIGFIGRNRELEKYAFIMNNLARATSHGVSAIEPAKAFFYIHKLTTADIDSFLDDHPSLETVSASVTDLYDLLLPHVATKNDVLEADGYRQAAQKDNAIVFYADCITYTSFIGTPQ
jgi:hypothetical protein